MLAVASVMLSTTAPSLADAVANIQTDGATVQSLSKAAQAELVDGGTAYKVTVNGKLLYTTSPIVAGLNLGTAHISDDGQTIAWLLADHFCGVIDNKSLQAPAVIFFHKGQMVKTYGLSELLIRNSLVSRSVSHTQWIPETRDANWNFQPTVKFAPDGSKLEFETTSMRHYTFDPRTGNMTNGEDSTVWKNSDVILYGQFTAESGVLHLKKPIFIKGRIENAEGAQIKDETGTFTSGWHTLALRKDGSGWTTVAPDYKVATLYNVLDSAPGVGQGGNGGEGHTTTGGAGGGTDRDAIKGIHPLSYRDFQKSVQAVDIKKHTISLEDYTAEHDKPGVYTLDLRSADEYKQGHIKGALLFGSDVSIEHLQKLVPDKKSKIVIYCTNTLFPTRRISLTHSTLSQFVTLGYTNTFALQELWMRENGRTHDFTDGPLWDKVDSNKPK